MIACAISLSLSGFAYVLYVQAQVIVVNGNIGCSLCRQRVSQVISKISGNNLGFDQYTPTMYLLLPKSYLVHHLIYASVYISKSYLLFVGLKEYTVDVQNKQVIAKGDVKLYATNRRFVNKRKKNIGSNKKQQHLLIELLLKNRLVMSLLN